MKSAHFLHPPSHCCGSAWFRALDPNMMAPSFQPRRFFDPVPLGSGDPWLAPGRALLANGYEPIPVNGKRPLAPSRAAGDITPGWAAGDITLDRFTAMLGEFPGQATGIGLRTGHVAAIDIDIVNEDHAREVRTLVEECLGHAPVRFGSKGSLSVYRCTDGEHRKLTIEGRGPDTDKPARLVEMLGRGQQFVAYGRHPDTGGDYEWDGGMWGDDPLHRSLGDLPAITPKQRHECAERIVETLARLGYQNVKTTGAGLPGAGSPGPSTDDQPAGDPVSDAHLRAMLACIDPACGRGEWIKVLAAARHACDRRLIVSHDSHEPLASETVIALVDEWSRGGLHPSGEPRSYRGRDDVENTWSTLDRGANVSTLGSLILLARQGGYVGPTRWRNPEDVFSGLASPDDADENDHEQLCAIADAFDSLNSDFAVLTKGPNAGRVVSLCDPRAPQILPHERFHTLAAKTKAPFGTGKSRALKSASPYWLKSRARREVSGIVFEPAASPNTVPETAHNTWQGFETVPRPPANGREEMILGRFLEHLEQNVCDGHAEHYAYLLDWMADLVQRPGDKPGVAVMLHSREQGTGKSLVSQVLAAMVSPHQITLSSHHQLTSNFNADTAGKVLLRVEEATWGGDRRDRGMVKDLITGSTIRCEPKGVDAYAISNHAHLFATSNEDWALGLEATDRRWFVLEVSPRRLNDHEFFAPIWAGIKDRSLPAALLWYLQQRRYDRARLLHPPMTSAKFQQIEQGLDAQERWWLGVLRDGAPEEFFDGSAVSKDELLRAFRLQRVGPFDRGNHDGVFWKRQKAFGCIMEERRLSGGARPRGVVLHPLARCRAEFAKHLGCTWDLLSGAGDGGEAAP